MDMNNKIPDVIHAQLGDDGILVAYRWPNFPDAFTQYTRTSLTYPKDRVDALIEAARKLVQDSDDSFCDKGDIVFACEMVEEAISALQGDKSDSD